MASHEFEMRRRLLSRSFHYQLKQSEKVRKRWVDQLMDSEDGLNEYSFSRL